MGNTREITLEYAEAHYELFPKYYLRQFDDSVHLGSFCVNKYGYVQLVREIYNKTIDYSVYDFEKFVKRFIGHCKYCIDNHKPVENMVDGVSGIKIWNEKIIDWDE